MQIENLKPTTDKATGKSYALGAWGLHFRKADCTGGDHEHENEEIIFLISGELTAEDKDESKKASAPAKIIFPAKTWHKVTYKTDVIFIEKH
jgi:mannose-6-phosphate isomerase-like protein (cupin superfamily)